jgi:predicted CDP-diglyceride synthetase/phosphatidate cytidylyltransferase
MRSLVINKILSFQYRLGKLIGKRKAARICIVLEKTFTGLFGREVYNGGE